MIESGNKEPSKSTSWKVLETVMSHLKKKVIKRKLETHFPTFETKTKNATAVCNITNTAFLYIFSNL